MMKQFKLSWMFYALLSVGAQAAQPDKAVFQHEDAYVQGPIIVQPLNGGTFVYSQTDPAPNRKTTEHYTLGRVRPIQYELFSDQEEDALWKMRQAKLDEQNAVMQDRTPIKKKHAPAFPHLTWPRVVVNEPEICVPALSHSDADDWRDYLICWNKETSSVK